MFIVRDASGRIVGRSHTREAAHRRSRRANMAGGSVEYSTATLRRRAESLAKNILYGMPDGSGGLKEWGAGDIARAYEDKVPPRWVYAILKLRPKYRLYYGPAHIERYAYGSPGTKEAERDYADAILRILKSDSPENTAAWIYGEARDDANRAGGQKATIPERGESQRSRHRKWTAYILENGYYDDGAFFHDPATITKREAEAEAWRTMADEDAYYAQRPRAYEGYDEDLPSDVRGRL